MENMPEESRLEVLINMSDDAMKDLTAGLGAAYVDDKRLPAAERARNNARRRRRARAQPSTRPGLESFPRKVGAILEGADAAQLAEHPSRSSTNPRADFSPSASAPTVKTAKAAGKAGDSVWT